MLLIHLPDANLNALASMLVKSGMKVWRYVNVKTQVEQVW
jgi:hypothetical protein